MTYSLGTWPDGLAEWTEGDTAYLSVAFTWKLDDAWSKAVYYKALGYKVRAGGPGIFTRKHYLADVAELGGDIPDAIQRHNPMATIASRGCPVGCWFCIVPKMEGRDFTLLPDFPVRPVLCDNNLSALPADYQDHIVARYRAAGVPLQHTTRHQCRHGLPFAQDRRSTSQPSQHSRPVRGHVRLQSSHVRLQFQSRGEHPWPLASGPPIPAGSYVSVV